MERWCFSCGKQDVGCPHVRPRCGKRVGVLWGGDLCGGCVVLGERSKAGEQCWIRRGRRRRVEGGIVWGERDFGFGATEGFGSAGIRGDEGVVCVGVRGVEGIGKHFTAFKAFVGVFGESGLDDVVDGGWDGGIPKAHGWWGFVAVGEKDFEDGFTRKGELSGGELVECDTKRVDIDAVIEFSAFGLFGSEVGRGSKENAFFGLPFGIVEKFGDPEVEDFGDKSFFTAFEEDIGGFEIAVDNALTMGVMDDFEDR